MTSSYSRGLNLVEGGCTFPSYKELVSCLKNGTTPSSKCAKHTAGVLLVGYCQTCCFSLPLVNNYWPTLDLPPISTIIGLFANILGIERAISSETVDVYSGFSQLMEHEETKIAFSISWESKILHRVNFVSLTDRKNSYGNQVEELVNVKFVSIFIFNQEELKNFLRKLRPSSEELSMLLNPHTALYLGRSEDLLNPLQIIVFSGGLPFESLSESVINEVHLRQEWRFWVKAESVAEMPPSEEPTFWVPALFVKENLDGVQRGSTRIFNKFVPCVKRISSLQGINSEIIILALKNLNNIFGGGDDLVFVPLVPFEIKRANRRSGITCSQSII